MGNCCGKDSDSVGGIPQGTVAFQGQGHRLGEAHEVTPLSNGQNTATKEEGIPEPVRDPTLTDEEREKKRLERIAAAEARLKKAGGPPKKKKEYKDVPLSGPNTKPTMTWTAG